MRGEEKKRGKRRTRKRWKRKPKKQPSDLRKQLRRHGVTGQKRSAKSLPSMSKKRKTVNNPEVNKNECCVCSGTYDKDVEEENGREWLNCTCGRWLHDDCVLGAVDLEEDATICPMCRSTENA